MREKFMIIDGNSLMHRAYHALPPLSAGDTPTNAVYGFLSMFFRAIKDEQPQYVGVAFDIGKHVFRHEIYTDYKAGRKKMDDELRSQFPIMKRIIEKMDIPILEKENYEADDIIGSVCNTFRTVDTYVLTGDKDALQLVDQDTFVMLMRKGISDIERFDEAHFKEVYGITPCEFVDVKALMGDSSDNIPGVPKVGEKTALKLISQYGSIENMYDHIDEQKGKLKENLENNKQQAEMSKVLAKIDTEMTVERPLADFSFCIDNIRRSFPILEEYNMKSLIKRVEKDEGAPTELPKEPLPQVSFEEVIKLSTIEQLSQALDEVASTTEVAILTGENEMYLSFGGKNYQIVFASNLLGEGMDEAAVFPAIAPMIAQNPLVVHDSKCIYKYFGKEKMHVHSVMFDVTLAAYLIDSNEKDYSISNLSQKYLGEENKSAQTLFHLKTILHQKLGNSESIYYNMELPLAKVLYDMEEVGFQMDVDALKCLGDQYREKLNAVVAQIHDLAGKEFNVGSPKQLGLVLFEDLGLPSAKKTKTGYATGADILEKMRDEHEIVPLILEYRKLSKLIGTYIDGFLPLIDKNNRVHTQFLQTGASTGRISSKEPNLQNIPVRTEEGREIRKAFVAKEGCMLVTGDYSQIDLRVLAHISGDELLQDAFIKGQDIHSRTASEIFHVPLEEVTKIQRRNAKAVNFGIVYGISPFGLSTNLDIPYAEAKEYIDRYLQKYQGVRQYMQEIVEEAKSNGYVETLLGRRRYIPQLKSRNRNLVAFGERIALNAPIQGTSADMIKLAMIEVNNRLEGMESVQILQVHDEILIEAPHFELDTVKKMLKDAMGKVMKLAVPVLVDVDAGANWYDAK